MVCTMKTGFATAVTCIAMRRGAIVFIPSSFHFKVQAPGRAVLTTQLFFPGEPRNQVDSLFRPQLLMNIRDTPLLMSAQFDFVIEA